MVTHVVCLDGTGQVMEQLHPTNIARIFTALGGNPGDGGDGTFETAAPGLTGKYLPGVGTQGDVVLKVLGNAFGDGIAVPIVRGYTYLSRNFHAGDQIVVTGFSRGATAARALAGFVVAQGLLDSTRYPVANKTAAYARAVAAWYRYRSIRPDLADHTRPDFIAEASGEPIPPLQPTDFTPAPEIAAVAVFDTVSSLGLSQPTFNGSPMFDFTICDTVLSDKVSRGFHALAADETRDLFSPTFWTRRGGVTQVIFPGCHSDVGGGFRNRGLSDGALSWMLEQLESVGLALDRGRLAPPLAPDVLAPAEDDGAKFPFNLTPRSARVFPDHAAPNDALIARIGNPAEMLPSVRVRAYKPVGTRADGGRLVT